MFEIVFDRGTKEDIQELMMIKKHICHEHVKWQQREILRLTVNKLSANT
jgi:hypothetical protein